MQVKDIAMFPRRAGSKIETGHQNASAYSLILFSDAVEERERG